MGACAVVATAATPPENIASLRRYASAVEDLATGTVPVSEVTATLKCVSKGYLRVIAAIADAPWPSEKYGWAPAHFGFLTRCLSNVMETVLSSSGQPAEVATTLALVTDMWMHALPFWSRLYPQYPRIGEYYHPNMSTKWFCKAVHKACGHVPNHGIPAAAAVHLWHESCMPFVNVPARCFVDMMTLPTDKFALAVRHFYTMAKALHSTILPSPSGEFARDCNRDSPCPLHVRLVGLATSTPDATVQCAALWILSRLQPCAYVYCADSGEPCRQSLAAVATRALSITVGAHRDSIGAAMWQRAAVAIQLLRSWNTRRRVIADHTIAGMLVLATHVVWAKTFVDPKLPLHCPHEAHSQTRVGLLDLLTHWQGHLASEWSCMVQALHHLVKSDRRIIRFPDEPDKVLQVLTVTARQVTQGIRLRARHVAALLQAAVNDGGGFTWKVQGLLEMHWLRHYLRGRAGIRGWHWRSLKRMWCLVATRT